jgi:hypothetical protein
MSTKPDVPRADSNAYLTERMFCERYHVTSRTAQRWRAVGEGPPFVRTGPRHILYRLSDCEAWAAARTFRHRADELLHKAEAAA